MYPKSKVGDVGVCPIGGVAQRLGYTLNSGACENRALRMLKSSLRNDPILISFHIAPPPRACCIGSLPPRACIPDPPHCARDSCTRTAIASAFISYRCPANASMRHANIDRFRSPQPSFVHHVYRSSLLRSCPNLGVYVLAAMLPFLARSRCRVVVVHSDLRDERHVNR